MSEMEKTPGQILYESVYSTLFWSDQDEETRAIYEKDAVAVIAHHEATQVAGLRAQLAQVLGELERVRKVALGGCKIGIQNIGRCGDYAGNGKTILCPQCEVLRAAITPTTPKEAEHDPAIHNERTLRRALQGGKDGET